MYVQGAHAIAAPDATRFATRVLAALGAPLSTAADVAGWLVASDLAGHPSHGIIRLQDYAQRIARGSLVPDGVPQVRDLGRDSVVLVDARHGFGHPAAALLVDELVARVRRSGVALGGIVDVSHTGRLGEWAERAAREGTGLILCYASTDKSNVAAYGAAEGRLGTNPITAGVPSADGRDLVLDFATSGLAGGKMNHYLDAGEEVPLGYLLDAEGRPTTDPRAFFEGGMLQTFGAHKGYGLSLLASVLAGCVVGELSGDHSHGVFALAFDIGAFAGRDAATGRVDEQLRRMRTTPAAPGFSEVQVPGDYERAARAAAADVLSVPDDAWRAILDLAASLDVEGLEHL